MQSPGVSRSEDYVVDVFNGAAVLEVDGSGSVGAVDAGDCLTAFDVGVLESVVAEIGVVFCICF